MIAERTENTTLTGSWESRPEHEDKTRRNRYGPESLVREIPEDAGLRCWVSLPTGANSTGERCPGSAVVEVYGIRYCEAHGAEVRAGALEEMYFSAAEGLQLFDAPHVPEMDNRATMWALRMCADELIRRTREAEEATDEALPLAFPSVRSSPTPRPSLLTGRTRRGPDPRRTGPPEEWYRSSRLVTHKLMRLAHEAGEVALIERLEPMRQTTAAQLACAIQDAECKGHGRPNSKR